MEPPGCPLVSASTISDILMPLTRNSIITILMVGDSIGSVIFVNLVHVFTPSREAHSYISSGIFCSPMIKNIMLVPKPLHTLARIITISASPFVPNQFTFLAISPDCFNSRLIGPWKGSNKR